ncbi:trypsin-like peptidase domain-containing protein [candidate division KSB1 bacterium]|nr:trypsin-like peptidase domain-containing protein [candidate division KSB1 bacterium]
MMSKQNSLRLGVLLLFLGVILGLVISSGFDLTKTSQSSPPVVPVTNVPNFQLGSQERVPKKLLDLQSTSEAFIYVAELVVPSVVTIQSTRLINSADIESFHDRDDLRRFFRFKVPKEFRQQGAGSGIIVSKDGYILTNVHVVDKSERIRVVLSDNRAFDARIVGLDPLTEVAVIKIDATNLPAIKLGDSDKARVGEWVLAIGNPLELQSTVTAGIISAKERNIDIIGDTYGVENFLQTDAAINPGNSGGALVNLRGEVIGINTAIATETGYSTGFGFAIPINLANKIMTDLIRKGRVERGYLGIGMQDIDEKKARALNLDRPKGVFVSQVIKGEPAARAGVKAKDVILKIEGQEVNKSNQVQAIIAKKNPGDIVLLELLRNGRKVELKVSLGIKETAETNFATNSSPKDFEHLGLKVQDLSRKMAKELDYSGSSGAVVFDVQKWSPADDAGIRQYDIITEIDNKSIRNENDFYQLVSNLEVGSVSIFTVVRFNEEVHIFVEIPEK